MAQHKWAKEIKAWADGAEIEFKKVGEDEWMSAGIFPAWYHDLFQYRIKPQPKRFVCNCGKCNFEIKQEDKNLQHKESKYLYVYWGNDCSNGYHYFVSVEGLKGYKYIGKIKLETEND